MINYNYHGLIYLLMNKINGKCYVGQTTQQFDKRIKDYRSLHCKEQTKLYNALKKYGWDNFETSLLCYAENQDELNEKEIHCAKIFNCHNNGYNIRECGSNGKMSEQTKLKMSISQTGKILSDVTRLKISEANKGKKISEETKLKQRKLKTEEHKKQCSIAQILRFKILKESGWVNPKKGKARSAEEKLKMSESHKRRNSDPSYINPFSKKTHSQETRQEMSIAQRNRFQNLS